ncbi:AT7L3 protein, partial [Prunella himalayana]|nr:AT7L3 protein [Prunella himalayana]
MKMEDMSLSGLDNSKLEAIAHEIYTELVEDACLGLCFEVHRAVKCGYFFLDDTDPDSMKDFEIVDQPGVDIFGQVYNQWKNKECVCPNCSRSIAASRFAPHLEKCLGMGRNSSRIANRRWAGLLPGTRARGCLLLSHPGAGDDRDLPAGQGAPQGMGPRGSLPAELHPPGAGFQAGNGDMQQVLIMRQWLVWAQHWETGGPQGCDGAAQPRGHSPVPPKLTCPFPPQQCGVISEHTKKMCTRSLRCPQHTDEQRRAVRVYLLGPSASLPEAEGGVENDSFEVAESQALMSRLQWDGSSDISPSDSASSKASECTNNSESRKTKKKKPHLGLVSGAPGLGSSKKKKPKPPAPHTPSIYDDIN